MVCDIKTGVCGEVGDESIEVIDFNQPQKKVDLYYVTDPICSHCWALEPELRRFEKQYGHYFTLQTVMGGLLKSWDGFADVSNGIGSPADVAEHWREVGEHSRMPIDGSLWLSDPIQSSYPPSRVYKMIQRENEEMAKTFLRRAREAVFAFNRNIGEEKVLIDLVDQLGLDGAKIVKEAEGTAAQVLLEEDFALAGSLGVRGFPTVIMVNEEKQGVKIVGAKKLHTYVDALKQVLPGKTLQARQIPDLKQLLDQESLLFAKEIEVMYDLEATEVESFTQEMLPADTYKGQIQLGEFYIEKL
ncbi:DsbA family protein [Paenibacillus puerhi]|uniref:DsbA family protein n=1 Tax=Paenibacillus puerhi TaxID=2692622 RepID=UPI001356C425|nr:DsbA family protein [Paenibacillus puerhi]